MDADLAAAPPRTLIVSSYALPHIGGLEVIVAQQARTLAMLGHPVTVVTSRFGADATRERVDGYKVVRIRAWNVLEKRLGAPLPIWSPAVIWRLAGLVRRSAVIHVHDVYHPLAFIAAAWSAMLRRPMFITQHVAVVDHDKAIVKLVQRLIYGSVARLMWRRARTITVYNPIVEAFIIGHGVPPGKIRLVYNGIDTTRFRPGDQESKRATRLKYGLAPDLPIVLFVGRLVPKKGLNKLIAARGPEYQIVVAGPGRIPEDIPPGVTFLGPLSRDDLRWLYQASDIFALPAISEMLTLAMQEAMACGLPVITTDDSNYARYGLDPTGVALVAPEPSVLRSTILDILTDSARKHRMQAYSRLLAEERFDWQLNASVLTADYDAALNSRLMPRSHRLPSPL